LIAFVHIKLDNSEQSCEFFEKALVVSKTINGEFSEASAQAMIQLAEA